MSCGQSVEQGLLLDVGQDAAVAPVQVQLANTSHVVESGVASPAGVLATDHPEGDSLAVDG